MANKIKGITVKIGGDTIDLDKALKGVNKTSGSLNSELNQINRQLKFDPSSAVLLAQKQEVLRDSINSAKEKLKELENVQQDIERQYQKGEIDDGQYRAYQREIEQTKSKIKSYENQLNSTKQTQQDFNRKIEAAKDTLDKNKQAFIDNGKKALKWGGIVAGAAATAAGGTIKYAEDFETAFAKVSTLLDDNRIDLSKYKQDIVKVSNEIGVSATDVAEAVYQSLSASVNPDKAVEFTKNAYKISKGGFTELATAVDILTTAMNAYGMEADNTSKISDILILTQNLGKTTVDQLAAKMGKVIPTAAAYGVTLEDIGTQYAILTKRGVNTANATTQIRQLLLSLTKESSKTLLAGNIIRAKTGKTFRELSEGGTGVIEVLDLLMNAVDGNIDRFSSLFTNVNAKAAALAIMSSGTEEYSNILNQMTNSAGTAETAYNKMAETTAHKLEVLKTNIENSAITIGEALLPTVNELLESAEDRLPEIQVFVKNLGGAITDGSKFIITNGSTILRLLKAGAIETAGIWTAVKTYKFTQYISETVVAMKTLKAATEAQKVATVTATAATEAETVAQEGLNVAMSANVIGAVISGLIVLGSTLWAVYSATSETKESTHELSQEEKELNDYIDEQAEKYKNLIETRKEAVSSVKSEYDYYGELYKSLKNITDENGKIKEGYEDKASFITTTLSDALGVEIKINDNIIQNYKDIQKELKNVIKWKRYAALQSAFEDEYNEAVRNQKSNKDDYERYLIEYNKAAERDTWLHNKSKDLKSRIDELKTQMQAVQSNDPAKANKILNRINILQGRYNEIEDELSEHKIERAMYNLEVAEEKMVKGNQIISSYTSLTEGIISENEGKVKKALNNLENDFISSKNGTEFILKQQVRDFENKYNDLKQSLADGADGVTQEMVDGQKKMLDKAKLALEHWYAQNDFTFKNTGRSLGESFSESYLNGLTVANADLKDKLDTLASDTGVVGREKIYYKGKWLASQFILGYVEGLRVKQEKMIGPAESLVALTEQAIAAAQDSHSPAKRAMPLGADWTQGYYDGMEYEASVAAKKTGKKLVNEIASQMKQVGSGSFDINASLNHKLAPYTSGSAFVTNSTSKIINNTPEINISFGTVSVRNDSDINRIADRVSETIAQRIELKGVSMGL